MVVRVRAFLACTVLFLGSPAQAVSSLSTIEGPNALTKVVTLLTEMKAQVAKEADADEAAYKKYACWCENGKKAKTEAISTAETRISDLESLIESSTATAGKLKTEIEELTRDIADDEASLQEATELREKEAAEFKAEEEDMSETLSALEEAIAVLEKVQLLQRGPRAAAEEGRPLLIQLRKAVRQLQPHLSKYRSVMQQDLWDLMGSLGGGEADSSATFLSRTDGVAFSQDRLSQPTGLVGGAAGSKSYNSRSGSILGMLKQMHDEFSENLSDAQKAEKQAAASFKKLKAAKTAEIAAAKEQKIMKEQELADNAKALAEAKNDLAETKEALSADQKVLVQLEKNCKEEDEGYASRSKARDEEMIAIAETIKILTEDDARTLFSKTVASAPPAEEAPTPSFLQVGRRAASQASRASRVATQGKALAAARRRLLLTARKHKNWALASLAVRVRLAPFTKVKEAMDKMIAELVQQQKDEDEKKDFCDKEIDSAEDSIKEITAEKNKLDNKKLELENAIKTFSSDLETLGSEITELQVSLKQASENRKEENLVFQQSVADQRATVQILKKALDRLQQFYAASLSQVTAEQEPGEALPTPPPKPSSVEYRKSEGAGGVLQFLSKIIKDAEVEEAILQEDEQHAQDDYAAFTTDATAALEAKNAAVAEKTKLKEEASGELASVDGSILSTEQELESMEGVLKARHLDCDFLLKYYQTRKEARQEEKEAIAEAKAILSGADLGEDEEEA